MKELKTILGTDVPITTRGILYLAIYDFDKNKLTITNELLCDSAFKALECYANIPNPESQLITGKTFDELITKMHLLHDKIKDPKWLEDLAGCL